MESEIATLGFRRVTETRYERGGGTFYKCDRIGRWYLRIRGKLPQELGRTKREAVNELIARRRADICLNRPFTVCISAEKKECPLRQFNDLLRTIKRRGATGNGIRITGSSTHQVPDMPGLQDGMRVSLSPLP